MGSTQVGGQQITLGRQCRSKEELEGIVTRLKSELDDILREGNSFFDHG
jgi:hypothetical protein